MQAILLDRTGPGSVGAITLRKGLERTGETFMKEVAIIVAYSDYETIWFSGMILQNPEWDWTVLSLCRATGPVSRPEVPSRL